MGDREEPLYCHDLQLLEFSYPKLSNMKGEMLCRSLSSSSYLCWYFQVTGDSWSSKSSY